MWRASQVGCPLARRDSSRRAGVDEAASGKPATSPAYPAYPGIRA
jgi:hypothetical protein